MLEIPNFTNKCEIVLLDPHSQLWFPLYRWRYRRPPTGLHYTVSVKEIWSVGGVTNVIMCGFEKGKKIWRGGGGRKWAVGPRVVANISPPSLKWPGGGGGLIQIAIQKGTGTFKGFRIGADIPMIIRWGVWTFCVKIFAVTVFFWICIFWIFFSFRFFVHSHLYL